MSAARGFRIDPPLGRPETVYLDGHRYAVRRVVDGWVVRSRWWIGDEQRLYARIETEGPVIEAFRSGAEWVLSRVLD